MSDKRDNIIFVLSLFVSLDLLLFFDFLLLFFDFLLLFFDFLLLFFMWYFFKFKFVKLKI